MAKDAPVAAEVETVRVAVPEFEPVIFTGLVEPKLKEGGYWAPVGLAVTGTTCTAGPRATSTANASRVALSCASFCCQICNTAAPAIATTTMATR